MSGMGKVAKAPKRAGFLPTNSAHSSLTARDKFRAFASSPRWQPGTESEVIAAWMPLASMVFSARSGDQSGMRMCGPRADSASAFA